MRRLFAAILALLCFGSPAWAANNYASIIEARPGLVAYWRMNDAAVCATLVDAVAGNNAPVSGTVTCGSTALLGGDASTSALFNGTTGYATPTTAAPFKQDGTKAFSIEAMITWPTTSAVGMIFSQQLTTGNDVGYAFWVQSQHLYVGLQVTSANRILCNYVTTPAPTAGNATHVVVTYDGSGTGAGTNLYVNGIQFNCNAEGNISGSITNAAVPLIGQRAAASFFNGNIQELAYYNVVLTPWQARTDALGALNNTYLQADLPAPVNVIYDTGYGSDADDTGSQAVLDQMMVNGDVNIIAMITVGNMNFSCAAAFIVNRFYGLPNIPIGCFEGSTGYTDSYGQRIATQFGFLYSRTNAALWPNSATQAMWNALCAQPDGKTILIIGATATNEAAFLQLPSATCGTYGSLTGLQVFTNKVYRVIWLAGIYPTSSIADPNMDTDVTATNYFLANSPVETVMFDTIMANNLPNGFPTGLAGSSMNPVASAYVGASYSGKPGRPIWNDMEMFGAAFGLQGSGYFMPGGIGGTVTYSAGTQAPTWAQTSGMFAYIEQASTAAGTAIWGATLRLQQPSVAHLCGRRRCNGYFAGPF